MGRQAGHISPTKSVASRAAFWASALALLLGVVLRPAQGQGVQTVLHAQRRVFPDVGSGAAVIERDAAGRYYILAAPASVIHIYTSDGKHLGQIPNLQPASATIKYAVDFDLDASGRVFVADRGANAVKIFTPDGVLEASVAVNAPMSVVALANAEFAVVTLRSDHLVRVMNEHGKLLRSFGNISDAVNNPSQLTVPALSASTDSATNSPGYAAGYATGPPPAYAMDIGKLYSGTPGDIYFAFTSLTDPKFRKYDRFGYSGYEAEVSANALIPDINHDNSQVQLGMHVSGITGEGEMFSFGSMYSVGGGAGFTMNSGHGGGGRRGGSAIPGGTGAGPGSATSSPGTASGGSSDNGLTTGSATGSGDASDLSGSLSANSGNSSASSESSDTTDFSALLGLSGANGGLGAPGMFGPGAFGAFGGGFGGGFEHPALGAGGLGGGPEGSAGAAAVAGTLAGSKLAGAGGARGTESPGAGHGEYGEHYGRGGFERDGLHSFAGVVKFTERAQKVTAKPVIRALGVDRANQQVWAAIDDMLLHFDRDGNLLDIYRVATPQGAALQPVSILVEPDRLLLVADPAGIYEFARPDKSHSAGNEALKPQ
jgi:hypothetical protein